MSEPINPVDGGSPAVDEPTATVVRADPSPNYRITEDREIRITVDGEAIELE